MKFLLPLFLLVVSSSTLIAINPDRTYKITPDSLGLEYQQLTLTTPDNYELCAWRIYPFEKDKDTTIVVAYGDAGNMSYYLHQAAELAHQGYTILLFDYRGFGKSDDFRMNFNYLYYNEFAIDLSTAITWAQENIENNRTGIWALSMGTIIATITLQEVKVDFLLAEGLVINPFLIEKRIESENNPILLPEGYKSYPTLFMNLNLPILIFAGTEDRVTRVQDARKVVTDRKNRKLVIYEGKHLMGFRNLSEESFGDVYCDRINVFIAEL